MQKTQRTKYSQGWKLYPIEFVHHHIEGALAASVILLLSETKYLVAAALWVFLYMAYQGFSVIRKKDSAGLDVMDFMVGFGMAFSIIFVCKELLNLF